MEDTAVSHAKVLLIEDDPDGREVVGRILNHHRISTMTVGNAEHALVALQTQQFAAAVIDFHLPGLDGWSWFNAMKANPASASLPCIAITAFHSAEVAAKAVEAGFTAYFPKPLESSAFVRELVRVLT
jgi:CheY-like chemotaxis protein